MHAFGRLLPIETARQRLARSVVPITRTESVPLDQAFGRISAGSVRAPRPVPPVARAAWDGYAVRSADTRGARPDRPVALTVVSELYAEHATRARVSSGEAAAVATGATLPTGADGVAIFESVRRRGRSVVLSAPVRAGDRITPAGHDLAAGTELVAPGERLGPATLGILAACGVGTVRVYARPVVALLTSGNELQRPGERPVPGGVFECNLEPMAAVVRAAGGVPAVLPPVPDSPERISAAIRRALRAADLVLASGGSSVGERDHLPRVFPKFGRLLFHGLAVRPGKPTLAARAGDRLLVGLPGHPASCLTNMYWLVLPVVRALARQPGPGWTDRQATLVGASLEPSEELSTVVPLSFDGTTVRSTYRGSSAVTSLRAANGFVILPPGADRVRAGKTVTFSALDPPLG
jgi:molybdenum cofactor synthesis domain-containing protein